MAPTLRKYFIYDPAVAVGDEVGGLRVMDEGDDGLHVLAPPQMVQYFRDQGLLGSEPLAKISAAAKTLLAQVTRGRSEDEVPARLPKYSREMQSGAPAFAGTPARTRLKKARQDSGRRTSRRRRPK